MALQAANWFVKHLRKRKMFFKDRYDAGHKLAAELIKYKDENPVIVALPRGGWLLVLKLQNC